MGPFRFAWVFTMLAFFFVALNMGTMEALVRGRRGPLCSGLLAMLVGFGMRVAISGRAPVTNMYESVVYLAWEPPCSA